MLVVTQVLREEATIVMKSGKQKSVTLSTAESELVLVIVRRMMKLIGLKGKETDAADD
jgi:hypothetical protein